MSVEDREIPKSRRFIIAGVIAAVAALIFYALYRAATSETVLPKKVVSDVVQMRLVQPPPLPPPPPRPKMVDQPKMRELARETPVQQLQPTPRLNAAPPPGPLALDAQGQGPPDAFGLAGRPGGSDILGGGAGGSAFGWYASLLEGRIQDALRHDRSLRGRHYDAGVKLWLSGSGEPQRAELLNSTGASDLDRALTEALRRMPPFPKPPAGMPQPVVVRVSSS